jgi:hypothetical protein
MNATTNAPAMTAQQLAQFCFDQDAANGHTMRYGAQAFDGWMAAADDHGDTAMVQALRSVRRRDFIAAWDDICTEIR